MDFLTCMRIENGLVKVSNEKYTSSVEQVCQKISLESASGQLFAITNIPSTSSLTHAQMLPLAVMKNVLFPKVITIFKLIYLLWFKIEQTLPGFGVTRFTSASASACFLSPFPGSCATWLRRCLNSTTLSTAHNWKTNRGTPGQTPKFAKKKG